MPLSFVAVVCFFFLLFFVVVVVVGGGSGGCGGGSSGGVLLLCCWCVCVVGDWAVAACICINTFWSSINCMIWLNCNLIYWVLWNQSQRHPRCTCCFRLSQCFERLLSRILTIGTWYPKRSLRMLGSSRLEIGGVSNFKVPYPATPWVLKTWSFFSTSTTLIKALLKDLDGSWMSGRWVAFPAAKLFPCWNCIGLTVDSKVDLKTRKDSRVITSESPKRGLYWFVCHMKFDEIWAVEERPPMLWGDPDLLKYDLFETMSQVHDRPENRN